MNFFRTERQQNRISATLFSLPAFLVYSIFMVAPTIVAFYLALTKWNGMEPAVFIGLKNFSSLLKSRDFWIAIKNTFVLLGLSICVQVPVALILAYLLYRTPRLLKACRSIYYMPAAISTAVIGIMFSLLLNADLGPINHVLKSIGLTSWAHNWLTDKNTVLLVVCACMIWQFIGYHMVIILAGMLSIPKELIESATLEGASSWNIFSRIVIPLCKDMLEVCMMLAIIGSFKAFDIPYMMTWGGPGTSSTFLAILMFKTAFLKADLGKGTAIGIVILLFALVGTQINNMIFRKKENV